MFGWSNSCNKYCIIFKSKVTSRPCKQFDGGGTSFGWYCYGVEIQRLDCEGHWAAFYSCLQHWVALYRLKYLSLHQQQNMPSHSIRDVDILENFSLDSLEHFSIWVSNHLHLSDGHLEQFVAKHPCLVTLDLHSSSAGPRPCISIQALEYIWTLCPTLQTLDIIFVQAKIMSPPYSLCDIYEKWKWLLWAEADLFCYKWWLPSLIHILRSHPFIETWGSSLPQPFVQLLSLHKHHVNVHLCATTSQAIYNNDWFGKLCWCLVGNWKCVAVSGVIFFLLSVFKIKI